MIAARIVFWVSFAVCLYVYFGYPLLLWIISRLHTRAVDQADITPHLTMIVPAYNEAKNIAAKIENSLALDYPADRLEIVIASNGSTDGTNDIVRSWSDARVRLLALEQPGKAAALNEAARQATGEILVLTDADFLLEPQALRAIARQFNDFSVGGVCGARSGSRKAGDTTGEGEGLYARWDRWQKIRESRIGSVFAADGLLYALRRELYVPMGDPAQADDIAISTRVVLQGFRLLFVEEAAAWENATVHAAEEFQRKIRVTGHSVRALLNLRSHLFTHRFYSVELLSHKLVRHLIPFFLIPLFLANAVLATVDARYAVVLAAQVAFYLLAASGAALRSHPLGRAKLFYIPYFFCFVNAAAFLGVLSLARGRRLAAWSSRAES